MADKTEVGYR